MGRAFAVALLCLTPAIPAASESIQLIRDAYATPHIFATTPAGAAYGAGYAQAEDRPAAVLTNLRQTPTANRIGERSPVETLTPKDLSPELAAIVDAYIQGVNQSLSDHGRKDTITAQQVLDFSRQAYSWILASNDLLVDPARTSSKSVIAILDPLADWDAPTRPYEMSIYTEGLALAGFTPAGMPFPIVGHNVNVSFGWSPPAAANGDPLPWPLAGPRALEQAWRLANARDLEEARRALDLAQIPGRAMIGTSQGDIFDSAAGPEPSEDPSGSRFERGYLRRRGPSIGGDRDAREQLRLQLTWPFASLERLAFSTEVYNAEAWQKRLARSAPGDRLARRLTGWDRRAEPGSAEALAFYVFKMQLGRDSASTEPPDSLSDARLFAALDHTRDVLETELEYNSKYGTLFRIVREQSRASFPVGGGDLPEAGIYTPRSLIFSNPTTGGSRAKHLAHAGQAATRIVELGPSGPTAVSVLLPGISDDPNSPYFMDQAERLASEGRTKRSFFNDRRELERTASSKKELIFSPDTTH